MIISDFACLGFFTLGYSEFIVDDLLFDTGVDIGDDEFVKRCLYKLYIMSLLIMVCLRRGVSVSISLSCSIIVDDS